MRGALGGSLIDDPSSPDGALRRVRLPENHQPVARPVPGKPGFAFSPFNNKIIDLVGIPPGTLVADPAYAPSEKKYFRAPEPDEGGQDEEDGRLDR